MSGTLRVNIDSKQENPVYPTLVWRQWILHHDDVPLPRGDVVITCLLRVGVRAIIVTKILHGDVCIPLGILLAHNMPLRMHLYHQFVGICIKLRPGETVVAEHVSDKEMQGITHFMFHDCHIESHCAFAGLVWAFFWAHEPYRRLGWESKLGPVPLQMQRGVEGNIHFSGNLHSWFHQDYLGAQSGIRPCRTGSIGTTLVDRSAPMFVRRDWIVLDVPKVDVIAPRLAKHGQRENIGQCRFWHKMPKGVVSWEWLGFS